MGMVRNPPYEPIPLGGFPHARGDGPQQYRPFFIPHTFSPRPWGWSVEWQCQGMGNKVFPTPVGMVRAMRPRRSLPRSFPHARGDGPVPGFNSGEWLEFSPRPWGWSVSGNSPLTDQVVFPTPVGMVLESYSTTASNSSFPHAGGVGPYHTPVAIKCKPFPPGPWGWSEPPLFTSPEPDVFPTPVGMVRRT